MGVLVYRYAPEGSTPYLFCSRGCWALGSVPMGRAYQDHEWRGAALPAHVVPTGWSLPRSMGAPYLSSGIYGPDASPVDLFPSSPVAQAAYTRWVDGGRHPAGRPELEVMLTIERRQR